MRHKIKALLALISVLLSNIICNMTVAFADDVPTSTINVSPMAQRIILIPGETAEGTIKVSNPYVAKQDLKYSVSIGAFSQIAGDDSIDDYGSVDTGTVTKYNQIIDWISLDKKSGNVAPNETDKINFKIVVPADAPAGGQYATILVADETDYIDDDGGGNVAIQSKMQIGSIIYADVAGETREEGKIKENNVPSFLLSNTLEAVSMVQNDGNVHTDAEYILQVWPMFSDEEVCTNEEDPTTGLVLPETEKYHVETCDLPSIGLYRVKQTVTIFGETSIVEKTIIYCPAWLLFLILAIIIILIMLIVSRIKSRNKAAQREETAV